MKTFHLMADVQFEAEDLDDATTQLSKHFAGLCSGEDESLIQFLPVSEISLEEI